MEIYLFDSDEEVQFSEKETASVPVKEEQEPGPLPHPVALLPAIQKLVNRTGGGDLSV